MTVSPISAAIDPPVKPGGTRLQSNEIIMLARYNPALPTGAINRRSTPTGWIGAWAVLSLMTAGVAPAQAGTNGTWTNTASGGLWSAGINWSSGIVATGTDGIANFGTL